MHLFLPVPSISRIDVHVPLLVVNTVFYFKLQNLGWCLWINIREESFSHILYCYSLSVKPIHTYQLLSTVTLKLILHNFGNILLEKELNRIFSKATLLLSSDLFQKHQPQK